MLTLRFSGSCRPRFAAKGFNCTCPIQLLSPRFRFKVFEVDGRTGGKLRSILQDGLIYDKGANTTTESEADVWFLLDNLGIRDKQQFERICIFYFVYLSHFLFIIYACPSFLET